MHNTWRKSVNILPYALKKSIRRQQPHHNYQRLTQSNILLKKKVISKRIGHRGYMSTYYCNLSKLEAQRAELVLLILHSVLRKLYTEPSIGVSYQISVHLVTRFQKSTNQKQELPMVGLTGKCSQRTFHRCFLSSFSSFGRAISEEKIFFN